MCLCGTKKEEEGVLSLHSKNLCVSFWWFHPLCFLEPGDKVLLSLSSETSQPVRPLIMIKLAVLLRPFLVIIFPLLLSLFPNHCRLFFFLCRFATLTTEIIFTFCSSNF